MKQLGRLGEDLAADHYVHLGYRVLSKNYVFRRGTQVGEIDLIVLKDRELVFVEVKTRTNEKFGSGLEAVDWSKQRKLITTAKLYLLQNPEFQDYDYRIDVATVDIDNLEKPVIILMNAIEDPD